MRLHNRQLKAGFWTDGELLRWPLAKRVFYAGLAQLADDSGCLENDAFAFKTQIFPSPVDAKVTMNVLKQWVLDLVAAGKLIPYTADGKECLYMKNFHKHQKLRSPAPPCTPLPAWIVYEAPAKAHESGKYTVGRPYGVLKDTVTCPYPAGEPKPEPSSPLAPQGAGETPVLDMKIPEGKKAKPKDEPYSKAFAEFWKVYPNRAGKQAANRCFLARVRDKVPVADMVLAARRYAAKVHTEGRATRHILHGSTFLGPDEYWKEELESEEYDECEPVEYYDPKKPVIMPKVKLP